MSYCTREDLEARIGIEPLASLADLDMDGAEDRGAIDRALADADADIDAALAVRWPECQGTASALLTRLACDLSIGYLARGPQRTTEIMERATAATKTLRDIAAGDLRPCGSPDTAGAVGDVQMQAGRRAFGGGIY
jgi:phage gp36-like protein